jgi:hypothetical protein
VPLQAKIIQGRIGIANILLKILRANLNKEGSGDNADCQLNKPMLLMHLLAKRKYTDRIYTKKCDYIHPLKYSQRKKLKTKKCKVSR